MGCTIKEMYANSNSTEYQKNLSRIWFRLLPISSGLCLYPRQGFVGLNPGIHLWHSVCAFVEAKYHMFSDEEKYCESCIPENIQCPQRYAKPATHTCPACWSMARPLSFWEETRVQQWDIKGVDDYVVTGQTFHLTKITSVLGLTRSSKSNIMRIILEFIEIAVILWACKMRR